MAGVGDFFKTVGKVAFPFLSTAAVAGGPLTAMAAQTIGKALGITGVEPTAEGIAKVMENATVDPATRLLMQKAEQDFQLQMGELTNNKIKTVQDFEAHLEQIAADDRKDARNREIQVRDRTPQVAFFMLLFGFFVALGLLCKYAIPADNKGVIFSMIGSLGTLTIMAATYYYGTTVGSSRKTELLAQAPSVEPKA